MAKALPRFQLKMDIQKVGENFVMTGTKGPDSDERVPDNTTLTDIDLGSKIGGKRKATAEIVGDSLISYLHKLEDNQIDVILNQTVTQQEPSVMTYSIKDVPSGTAMIQHLDKQP